MKILKGQVSEFVRDYSIEVTPKGAKKIEYFSDYLEPYTPVYVTALPGSDFLDTIATCKRLAEENMTPVPHFTARGFKNDADLEMAVSAVTQEAGVKQILAIAGAHKQPAGKFSDTISMLQTGLFDKYGINSIGIAGHPEGSSDIDSFNLKTHKQQKIQFSEITDVDMYMVTQFVFEAQPIIDWIEHIREEGNQLPVRVGIPGIASLKSLINHATACGIGASKTMLFKHAKNIPQLLSLHEPNKLIRELVDYAVTTPEANILGCHLYPFGGFELTSQWQSSIAQGHFELTADAFKRLSTA